MVTQFFDKVLVDNWREAWKFYSLWAYAVVAALPQIAELAAQFGILSADAGNVPESFASLLKWAAFFGALVRLLKQLKPAQAPAAEAQA